MKKIEKIVISRTDSIGDVALTLPLAGILKERYPDAKIIFLGNTYTKAVIETSKYVDEVWEWAIMQQWDYNKQVQWLKVQEIDAFLHVFPRKEIARIVKKAAVPMRIGTSHRVYHLLACNKLVNFTRKRSELHEAQLNTKLLEPLGIKQSFSLKQLSAYAGFEKVKPLSEPLQQLLSTTKHKVVLHPKSKGSAIEWGVENFMKLTEQLDPDKHEIFITGTEAEAEFFRNLIPTNDHIHDMSGKMTLDELISFIASCDSLVAASTGPLHIAGLANIHAIGLFQDKKPIHAGRWKPLGNQVTVLNSKKNVDVAQPLDIEVRDVEKAILAKA